MAQALQAGEFEELGDGRFRAAGHELEPDEVLVERGGREGWSVAASEGVTVALDLTLDDALLLEGRVFDLIRKVNTMRKGEGLDLTDRIVLTVPTGSRTRCSPSRSGSTAPPMSRLRRPRTGHRLSL